MLLIGQIAIGIFAYGFFHAHLQKGANQKTDRTWNEDDLPTWKQKSDRSPEWTLYDSPLFIGWRYQSQTAKDKDVRRACRRPKRGGSKTSGSPQKSEENRKGKTGTTSWNRPGSGGRAYKKAGICFRSHQKIPTENVWGSSYWKPRNSRTLWELSCCKEGSIPQKKTGSRVNLIRAEKQKPHCGNVYNRLWNPSHIYIFFEYHK